MLVDELTIEKLWKRFEAEGTPAFPLRMDNFDYTGIDLYGDPGGGHALRSDGIVIRWEYPKEAEDDYVIEVNPGMCIGALVVASERRIPELKEILPQRPDASSDCRNCNGEGFTGPPYAPRLFLCQTCWGLGWEQ